MQLKNAHILILSLILLSTLTIVAQTETNIKLLTTTKNYQVGNNIVLKFTTTHTETPLLYCSNSYGSTIVSGTINNKILEYSFPKNIIKKIGVINWKLLDTTTPLTGTLQINPKAEVASIETYIGPPSIEAGGTDYTMLVVIPTDSLDNPVSKNTLVHAKHQFLNSEEKDSIYTNNLIAFKTINSKKESGRILVSSESLGKNSKEFTINVWAAAPTNFSISATRPHAYADGNQITTFTTSIIKDRYNNRMSDGTYVTFFITNSKGNILKTAGTTIGGIAIAKMIHPDYIDSWSVKAYVDGMAESNTISLSYKQVIDDFKVVFMDKNRTITVGPLQSFMQQMIPDGLQVKLQIYNGDVLIDTFSKTSFNGYVNFNLKSAILENGTYNFRIETAGKEKTFKTKKLW